VITTTIHVNLHEPKEDPASWYFLELDVTLDLEDMPAIDWTLLSVTHEDYDGVIDAASLREHGREGMQAWTSKLADRHDDIEAAIIAELQRRIRIQ
jgi:hypothetical protein